MRGDGQGAGAERVGRLAAAARRRLGGAGADEDAVSALPYADLRDLDCLLQMAGYVLCRRERGLEAGRLLGEVVSIIDSAAASLGDIEAEEAALEARAGESLARLLGRRGAAGPNVLTESSTPAYTRGYQAGAAASGGGRDGGGCAARL